MPQKRTKSQNITIFDVADEAGVSYATVSRVINNQPYVKDATRERVQAAMKKLGYVADMKARGLAGIQSHIIGLLLYELESGYFTEIVKGVDAELSASEYDLILATTHQKETRASEYVIKLANGLVDGLLLVLPRNLEYYMKDFPADYPCVFIDRGLGDRSIVVTSTNRAGAFEATSYLLDLGHERIGFIAGPLDSWAAQERLVGYQLALEKYHIPLIPELLCEGDFTKRSGYACTKMLLALAEPPSAIFASSDSAALGAMDAIFEQHLHIPDDISLVGFDNIPNVSSVHPGLTTVEQPLQEIGRVATRLLIDQIDGKQFRPQRIELPTRLIIRESCRRAPR